MPPKDIRPRFRPLRIATLVGVPILAFAYWLSVQPHDRMAFEYSELQWQWLVYDPYDLSAMALRGMNAEMGRSAGAPVMPQHISAPYFSRFIETPRPLKPRYFLEYPHAVLLLFRVGYWIQPEWHDTPIPPGMPDCSYHNIAMHIPENEDQIAIWRCFVVATRFYVGVMVLAWIMLMAVLEWGYGQGTDLAGGSLLLLLPGSMFFTLNRFDILPALLTALSFACLGRRRVIGAGLFLGMATVVKVYPILFVPLLLRYLWPDRRLVLQFVLAYVAANFLSLAPALFGDDWQAIAGPYLYQLTRPPERGLTIYGCILPDYLAQGLPGMTFRMGALALVMGLVLATPIPSLNSLLRRCALVLIVFVSFAVFYSPQWLLWFAPLLLPLVGRNRRIGGSIIALDIVTYLTFPFWFFTLPDVIVEIAKLFDALPEVGKDGAVDKMLDTVLTQIGILLRISRFICIGFMTWYIARDEFPIRAWIEHLRHRQWRSTQVLAHES